jgi:hypothetical protein
VKIVGEREAIDVADVNVFKFTVTKFEVSHDRTHLSGSDVSSATTLRLNLQGAPMSEAHRPIELAFISFTGRPADSGHGIGDVERHLQFNHDALMVSLPAADFDKYWKILTLVQDPHLRCITPRHSTVIESLTLSSAQFHEGDGL